MLRIILYFNNIFVKYRKQLPSCNIGSVRKQHGYTARTIYTSAVTTFDDTYTYVGVCIVLNISGGTQSLYFCKLYFQDIKTSKTIFKNFWENMVFTPLPNSSTSELMPVTKPMLFLVISLTSKFTSASSMQSKGIASPQILSCQKTTNHNVPFNMITKLSTVCQHAFVQTDNRSVTCVFVY